MRRGEKGAMRDVLHEVWRPSYSPIGRIFEDDRCLAGRETGGDGQVDGPVQESIGSSQLLDLIGSELVLWESVGMISVTYWLGASVASLVGRVEESSYGEGCARECDHHGVELPFLCVLHEQRVLGVVHEIVGPTTADGDVVVEIGYVVPSEVFDSIR
jgi:hypothetical protein